MRTTPGLMGAAAPVLPVRFTPSGRGGPRRGWEGRRAPESAAGEDDDGIAGAAAAPVLPGRFTPAGRGGPRPPRGRRGFRVRRAGGGRSILTRGKEGRGLF